MPSVLSVVKLLCIVPAKHNSGVSSASWKDFYGSLRHLHGERETIDAVIEEEFEQVDTAKWS